MMEFVLSNELLNLIGYVLVVLVVLSFIFGAGIIAWLVQKVADMIGQDFATNLQDTLEFAMADARREALEYAIGRAHSTDTEIDDKVILHIASLYYDVTYADDGSVVLTPLGTEENVSEGADDNVTVSGVDTIE